MATKCIPRIYTTRDRGQRKFAVDIALAFGSGYINRKLPMTEVEGRICVEYAE